MSSEIELPVEIERYIFELCASSSDKAQQLVLMLVAKSVYDWICPVFYGDMEIGLSLKNWPAGWDRYKSLSGSPVDAPVRHLFVAHLHSLNFDVSWSPGFATHDTKERAEALMEVFSSCRPTHLFLELPEEIFDAGWGSIQEVAFSFPLTHLDLGDYTSAILYYPNMVKKLRSYPALNTVTHLSLYAGDRSPHEKINNLPIFRALTHVALYATSDWSAPIESIIALPKFLDDKTVVLVEPVRKFRGRGTWKTEDWLSPESHPNVAFFKKEYGWLSNEDTSFIHDVSLWDRAKTQLELRAYTK